MCSEDTQLLKSKEDLPLYKYLWITEPDSENQQARGAYGTGSRGPNDITRITAHIAQE